MLNQDETSIFRLAGDPSQTETVISDICQKGSINLADRDQNGDTLLAAACKGGNLPLARFLIERCGMNPFEGNHYGRTPFDHATAGIRSAFGFRPEEYIRNPVFRGFHPDPSVLKVGSDYYLVNSSFAYFPAIPISHSRDLVHWHTIGYALTNANWSRLSGKAGGRGYWAADISYDGSFFFVTATLRDNDGSTEPRIQMVVRSRKPEGPYGEPSWFAIDGIDPALFHTHGRHYMVLNRGCRIVQLNDDCTRLVSKPTLLWYGSGTRTPEGPHLMEHDGWYYIFLAEGGTGRGHQESCARSRTLEGPYTPCPHNPILKQQDEDGYLSCCGHGEPVEGPDGSWYFFFLGTRNGGTPFSILGRETCLAPMRWDGDGWPVVDRPQALIRIPKTIPVNPSPLCSPYPAWKGREWLTCRPLDPGRFRQEADGSLVVLGSSSNLMEMDATLFLERQSEFKGVASLSFEKPDLQEGNDVGITAYYDEHSFLKYGLARRGGTYGLLLTEFVGDHIRSERFLPVPERNEFTLTMRIDGLKRTFFCQEVETLTLQDTRYLASEGLLWGKRFTGAMLGLYVHGQFPVRFLSWSYTPTEAV
ncbi:MAG: family 43 glycosylhydrolase [Sphaerochaetaceae bacterium]|nr:family 43 glycosylhydrolase [Spirochaetales bacterium]MDY5499669.1 family 43 glycosylhydrolase [Sphaerochaetaceae bacterium]